MPEDSLAVLVCSCDAYSDLWPAFFTLFKKMRPALSKKRIILCTESKSFSFPGLDIVTYPCLEGLTWSGRLAYNLKKTEAEYLLFMLDDFFIEKAADEKKVFDCLARMKEDKNIVSFSFAPTLWETVDDGRYPGFVKRKRVTPFRVNTQAGLWRKKELQALLRSHEDIWDFEIYGSIRSRLRKGEYYCAASREDMAFYYDWFHGGAVHGGKWTESGARTITDMGFDIDLSDRGTGARQVLKPEDIPPYPLEKTFFGRLSIRLSVIKNHWRSLF